MAAASLAPINLDLAQATYLIEWNKTVLPDLSYKSCADGMSRSLINNGLPPMDRTDHLLRSTDEDAAQKPPSPSNRPQSHASPASPPSIKTGSPKASTRSPKRRVHFEPSTQPIPSDALESPREHDNEGKRRWERLQRRRNAVFNLRKRLIDERQQMRHHRETAMFSASDFMNASQKVASGHDSDLEALFKIQERMIKAYESLGYHEEIVFGLESRLTSLETKMQEAEARFHERTRKILSITFSDHADVHDTTNEDTAEVQDGEMALTLIGPPENLANILAKYDSSVGDISMFEERLHNLEVDHIQAKSMRELLAETDQTSLFSEKDFYEHYFSDLRITLKELAEARREADELKAQCLREGFNPDPEDVSQAATEIESERSSRGKEDANRMSWIHHPRFPSSNVQSLQLLSSGFITAQERVVSWLADLMRRPMQSSRRWRGWTREYMSSVETVEDLLDPMEGDDTRVCPLQIEPDPPGWRGEAIKRRHSVGFLRPPR